MPNENEIPVEKTNEKYNANPKGDWVSNLLSTDIEKYESTHKDWAVEFGPPRATKKFSIDNLKERGFVGVYFKSKFDAKPT